MCSSAGVDKGGPTKMITTGARIEAKSLVNVKIVQVDHKTLIFEITLLFTIIVYYTVTIDVFSVPVPIGKLFHKHKKLVTNKKTSSPFLHTVLGGCLER